MANDSASMPRPGMAAGKLIGLIAAAQVLGAASMPWLSPGTGSSLSVLAWVGYALAPWTLLLAWICHRLVTRLAMAERAALMCRHDNAVLQEQLRRQELALQTSRHSLHLAEQACLDKTRFLAAASHDLRQPMHAITLFVAALKAENFEGRPHYLLDRLDRSIAGLDELFNRLLDLARLDAGIITPAFKTFDARLMAETLESRFAPMAASKALDFRIRCPEGLLVHSDPVLLDELLGNLLSNAFRNTQRGGVLLSMRERGGSLRIQVVDTGCGIPEQCFESIFDEFVQLNNPSRDRRKGSGLGLAIVKRLADVLGHRIRLRSRVGRGSCFELLMPSAPANSADPHESAAKTTASALDGALALVVDDEADILAAMEAILTAWGCHCITARSPAEAARYIDDSPRFPDVIITDHRLDNHLTGFDVVSAVAPLLAYEVPVIVISGECSPALEQQAQDRGYALISKPVNSLRLHRAIVEALAKTAAAMQKAA
ncbi:hybrid sensor histidine kinase/response regulator [Noviherbaspirillum sp. CPCC 100848]|uniref:histidine kinase n=1 Tax=Noviherbaspirillum album TaxID=3080276 RepID=A0ABU6J482_9BURK|nr:hybrid sensor histidine kinase/response regulator [Noviherbaspirillum sp. CPCC 100848]MEC4718019.1 hybrid sensor histidine kinase/response regulator [Noviherbaspirillum sp. CPCC 100848]